MPETRRAGLEALRDRLGSDGMLRFLQQYDGGRGDYTTERHEWLDDLTVDDIAKSVEARRGKP